jgi:hypothetical protein
VFVWYQEKMCELSETDGCIDETENQENPSEKYRVYLINLMKAIPAD